MGDALKQLENITVNVNAADIRGFALEIAPKIAKNDKLKGTKTAEGETGGTHGQGGPSESRNEMGMFHALLASFHGSETEDQKNQFSQQLLHLVVTNPAIFEAGVPGPASTSSSTSSANPMRRQSGVDGHGMELLLDQTNPKIDPIPTVSPITVPADSTKNWNMNELGSLIQVLQQSQDRFQHVSDQIIRRIDDITTRVVALEKNVSNLLKSNKVEHPSSPTN